MSRFWSPPCRSSLVRVLSLGAVFLAAALRPGMCQEPNLRGLTPEEVFQLDLPGLTSGQLAELYVDQFDGLARAEEDLELMKRAVAQMEEGALDWGPSGEDGTVHGPTRQELSVLLTDSVELLAGQMDEFEGDHLDADLGELLAEWVDLRKQRNQWDVMKAELLMGQPESQWLALLGKDTRWFWLWALVAIACLAGVSCHDRRHEIRRASYGAKARAYGLTRLLKWMLALMVVLAATAFFGGEHLVRFLATQPADEEIRSKEDMCGEITKVAERREAVEKETKEFQPQFQAKRDDWSSGEQDENLSGQWKRLEEETRKSRRYLAVQGLILAGIRTDGDKVDGLQGVIRANQAGLARLGRLKLAVKGGVGIVLSVLVVGLGVWLLAGIQRRDHKSKYTCPMCLGFHTLELDAYGSGSGIGGDMPTLRCHGKIGRDEDCPYTTRPFYQKMDKLYFPTLGIVQGGKTHCVAMVYRELNAGRYAQDAHFEKVESPSSEQFDGIVRKIIEHRINPEANPPIVPYPLIFNFCDNDPYGKSSVLVNVFDYSGEVTEGALATLNEAQRQRALRADGYLFFLDPTAPRDKQEKGLDAFRRHVREIGNVPANRSIRAPVALCVSKIDLLTKVAPDFVDHFHDELMRIDSTGQKLSLKIIEERSKLAEELRDRIWTGWDIGRLIDDLFGGRYMFFPLTPVSLDVPDNVDPLDLKNRAIDPFGIVEPLVWLLHMNGYPILKRQ